MVAVSPKGSLRTGFAVVPFSMSQVKPIYRYKAGSAFPFQYVAPYDRSLVLEKL